MANTRQLLTGLVTALLLTAPRLSQAQGYGVQLAVPLQFDFPMPGTRSLALGGAFTGLADDASAAFTNPAGLPQLDRAQISVEGRARRLAAPLLTSGRFGGGRRVVSASTP